MTVLRDVPIAVINPDIAPIAARFGIEECVRLVAILPVLVDNSSTGNGRDWGTELSAIVVAGMFIIRRIIRAAPTRIGQTIKWDAAKDASDAAICVVLGMPTCFFSVEGDYYAVTPAILQRSILPKSAWGRVFLERMVKN